MNIIVLDLETARSAEDCVYCGQPESHHHIVPQTLGLPLSGEKPESCPHGFTPIGWNNKPALGISIGCLYSYAHDRFQWFDEGTLEFTMERLVEEQPLMVSFNGITFDFPLMRGILRRHAEGIGVVKGETLGVLCDRFKVLAADSYDILAEIWRADPSRKFERGLNSLDAIAQANGLGPKLSHGAQAPRDWANGRHAEVLNYCQDDVYKTKALFEMILGDQPIKRGDGSEIRLPMPHVTHQEGK